MDVKFGPLSENSSPLWRSKLVTGLLVTVAFCQLCHSAQSFHKQIFQV